MSKSNSHGRNPLPTSLQDRGWDNARLMAARSKRSKPLLESFAIWLEGQAKKVLPKSPCAKAITYTRSKPWKSRGSGGVQLRGLARG